MGDKLAPRTSARGPLNKLPGRARARGPPRQAAPGPQVAGPKPRRRGAAHDAATRPGRLRRIALSGGYTAPGVVTGARVV